MELNVVVNGFEDGIDAAILERTFRGISLGYFLTMNTPEEQEVHVDARTQEYLSAHMIKWANYPVDWDTLLPLDEEIVERMRSCESMFLQMLSRWDTRRTLTFDRRERLYMRHLRFWNHMLETKKIHLFISKNIPHEGHDHILYSLCKERGIPTLMFHHINSILDTLLMFEDWRDPCPEIVDVIVRLRGEYTGREIPLSEKFEHFFQTKSKNQEEAKKEKAFTPWYAWTIKFPQYFPRISVSNLFSERFWVNFFGARERYRRMRNIFRFYDAKTVNPDLSKKFVYLPLHYQPEMTTCPMGGVFNDQLLIAHLLANTLPDNVLIYVKENPAQTEECRDVSYYQELLSIDRVRLIPREYNTFRLVDRCAAVATVTGTVGLEALLVEKPVLMFGYRFYQYAPGVFPIRTRVDCQKAVDAVFVRGERPSLRDVRVFLKALEEISFDGCVDTLFKSVTRLSEEENVISVSRRLREKVLEKCGVGDQVYA